MSLTTRDRVKERLDPEGSWSTQFDDLIDTLIGEVDAKLETLMSRKIAQDTYTYYASGRGSPVLDLNQGPLVSVTSVHHIVYEDDGAGGRQETATEVQAKDFILAGMRDEGAIGLGYLVTNGGWTWLAGHRNYKVVYVAGFSATPEAIAHQATLDVVAAFVTREATGLASKSVGDADLNVLSSPVLLDQARERALAAYTVRSIA